MARVLIEASDDEAGPGKSTGRENFLDLLPEAFGTQSQDTVSGCFPISPIC